MRAQWNPPSGGVVTPFSLHQMAIEFPCNQKIYEPKDDYGLKIVKNTLVPYTRTVDEFIGFQRIVTGPIII